MPPETKTIRILLLDDHSLFRESLRRLLEAESDFHVEASCSTVADAFAALKLAPVDVVLLDYDLGDEQGSSFLEEAGRRSIQSRVLLVTAGMGDAETMRVMERSAAGIFLKHSPPGQLIEAIRNVAAGGMWLDPKAVKALVAGARKVASEPNDAGELSERERSVLKGVFEGRSNKEIAAALNLSESSVKAALQQLFDKTGVRTRSQLVRIAIEKHGRYWLKAN